MLTRCRPSVADGVRHLVNIGPTFPYAVILGEAEAEISITTGCDLYSVVGRHKNEMK